MVVFGIGQYASLKQASSKDTASGIMQEALAKYPQKSSPGYGNGTIDVILFFDPNAIDSNLISFIEYIENEYIATSRITLFVKPIFQEDSTNMNALNFMCLSSYNSSATVSKLFNQLARVQETPIQSNCEKISAQNQVIESKLLGVSYVQARVYIGIADDYEMLEGIPTPQRFERLIRLKEILVGT
jgi:hypothetical protein